MAGTTGTKHLTRCSRVPGSGEARVIPAIDLAERHWFRVYTVQGLGIQDQKVMMMALMSEYQEPSSNEANEGRDLTNKLGGMTIDPSNYHNC